LDEHARLIVPPDDVGQGLDRPAITPAQPDTEALQLPLLTDLADEPVAVSWRRIEIGHARADRLVGRREPEHPRERWVTGDQRPGSRRYHDADGRLLEQLVVAFLRRR